MGDVFQTGLIKETTFETHSPSSCTCMLGGNQQKLSVSFLPELRGDCWKSERSESKARNLVSPMEKMMIHCPVLSRANYNYWLLFCFFFFIGQMLACGYSLIQDAFGEILLYLSLLYIKCECGRDWANLKWIKRSSYKNCDKHMKHKWWIL